MKGKGPRKNKSLNSLKIKKEEIEERAEEELNISSQPILKELEFVRGNIGNIKTLDS